MLATALPHPTLRISGFGNHSVSFGRILADGLSPQTFALFHLLHAHNIGAIGRNRTYNLRITGALLCLLSYNGIMVGEDGVEPTEPEGMRFTVSPATVYGILSHVASPQGFEPWHPIRMNGLATRRIKPLCHDDMAQRVGLEPTVVLPINGFQDRLLAN